MFRAVSSLWRHFRADGGPQARRGTAENCCFAWLALTVDRHFCCVSVTLLSLAGGVKSLGVFWEDVQNSVETRGPPELVVYAAWAWAGGGGDSLPSWSSNFGKWR